MNSKFDKYLPDQNSQLWEFQKAAAIPTGEELDNAIMDRMLQELGQNQTAALCYILATLKGVEAIKKMPAHGEMVNQRDHLLGFQESLAVDVEKLRSFHDAQLGEGSLEKFING